MRSMVGATGTEAVDAALRPLIHKTPSRPFTHRRINDLGDVSAVFYLWCASASSSSGSANSTSHYPGTRGVGQIRRCGCSRRARNTIARAAWGREGHNFEGGPRPPAYVRPRASRAPGSRRGCDRAGPRCARPRLAPGGRRSLTPDRPGFTSRRAHLKACSPIERAQH